MSRSVGVLLGCLAMLSASRSFAADHYTILGNDVPTSTSIPGLPGYSAYDVYIQADAGRVLSALDAGSNPTDYPSTTKNLGLFGPMHQRWAVTNGVSAQTPYHSNDILDSTFTFTFQPPLDILSPRENNNVTTYGFGSPLADDATSDYGIGDTMRVIVGLVPPQFQTIPFAHLVIPNGYSVEARIEVASHSVAATAIEPFVDVYTPVNFTVGAVPEPAAVSLLGLSAIGMMRRRR